MEAAAEEVEKRYETDPWEEPIAAWISQKEKPFAGTGELARDHLPHTRQAPAGSRGRSSR